MVNKDSFRFWKWVCTGIQDENGVSKSGFSLFFDWWMIAHLTISSVCPTIFFNNFEQISTSLVIPLSSVLFGISIAWASTSFSFILSDELIKAARYEPGGIVTFIYSYQLAWLINLITLSVWLLGALVIRDIIPILSKNGYATFLFQFVLYFLLSVSIRECWHVVKQTSHLMLIYIAAKERSH